MTTSRFVEGFFKSWGVILASEIGDKTFFIAAVMAMRNPRKIVFAGAMGALAAMTVLSALLGWAAPSLISRTYTHYAATALFFVFGIRMLYDVATNAHSGESELVEVEKELQASHLQRPSSTHSMENGSAGLGGSTTTNGVITPPMSPMDGKDKDAAAKRPRSVLRRFFSPVLLEAFTLTFLAEWGDRSQIATIGLAAASDVVGVTLGGIVGHALCTGAAVMGGRHLAAHIDERIVGMFGGVLFLVFALHSLWSGVPS